MRWQDLLAFSSLLLLWIGGWFISDLFKIRNLKKVFLNLGFSFDTQDPTLKNQYYSDFALLGPKKIRIARNIFRMQLADGIEITVFSLFTGISRPPVFVFEVPKLNMPHFLLMPRSIYSHIQSLLRKDQIKTESRIFLENYLLFSDDKNLIQTFFNKERIQMFERNQNVSMEGQGAFLAITFNSLQLTSKNAEAFLGNVIRMSKDFVGAGSAPNISPAILN